MLRRYWHPALLSSELPEANGAPVRVRLLGEDLIGARDAEGSLMGAAEVALHRREYILYY